MLTLPVIGEAGIAGEATTTAGGGKPGREGEFGVADATTDVVGVGEAVTTVTVGVVDIPINVGVGVKVTVGAINGVAVAGIAEATTAGVPAKENAPRSPPS